MTEETWIVYFRNDEDDPQNARFVTVDQATADPAIADRYPVLAVYTARLPADGLDRHRLPTPQTGQRLDAAEARAFSLGDPSSHRLVARITRPGERQWIFCHALAARPLMSKAATRLSDELDMPVTVQQAAWDEIAEVFPSRQEAARFWNWQIIAALRRSGDDGTTQRPITHSLYDIDKLADKAARADLERELRQAGYSIESVREDEITFSRIGPIDLEEINTETESLHALADRFGCGYNGWTTQSRGTP